MTNVGTENTASFAPPEIGLPGNQRAVLPNTAGAVSFPGATSAKGGGTGPASSPGHRGVLENKWLSKEPLLQQNEAFLGAAHSDGFAPEPRG